MSNNKIKLENYTVLDLENPNSKSDSICSLAILNVVNNKVVLKENILIDPEDRFDKLNISIHKITPDMVKNAITFDKLWPKISEMIENNVIVGHGIQSDLSLISKTLLRYGFKIPKFKAVCTCNLSIKHLDMEKFNLKAVCEYLNINLINHHDAMSDAVASYKVFKYFNDHFGLLEDEIMSYRYDINHYLKKQNKKFRYNQRTQSIDILG